MCELLINIIGTIIGGLLLTLFLFVLNEFVFPKKNLTGEWETKITIINTGYNPFKNLVIEYKMHLIQKGYELSGSGEKTKDIKPNGSETVFLRENRVNVEIDGYFERKYLGKSRIYLNIIENGRKRKTRTTYILTLKNKKNLNGTFISTAADSNGIVFMNKS